MESILKKGLILGFFFHTFIIYGANQVVSNNSGTNIPGSFLAAINAVGLSEETRFNLPEGSTSIILASPFTFPQNECRLICAVSALPFSFDGTNTMTVNSGRTVIMNTGRGNFSMNVPFVGPADALLRKTTAGTLTIGGDNTNFLGNFEITNGEVLVTNGGNLGSGVFVFQRGNTPIPVLTLSDGVDSFTELGMDDGEPAIINVPSGTATVSGEIGEVGVVEAELQKTGAGELILTFGNSYLSDTKLLEGSISLSGSGTVGAGSLEMTNGTALNLLSAQTHSNNIAIEGGGSSTVNVPAGGASTLSGVISGAGSTLIKTGSDTLTLSGNNTYSGGTTLTAGAIALSGPGTIGGGTLTMSDSTALNLLSAQTYANDIAIEGGGSGTVNVSGGANTLSGIISGASSTLIKTGSETLTLSGNNTYTGGTTLSAGAIALSGAGTIGDGTLTMSDGTALNLPGGKTVVNPVVIVGGGSGAVDVSGGGGASTLSGVISGAGSIFTKTGGDTLILSGANTYSGGTVISGGTLQLSGSLASAGAVTVSSGGATFDISGGSDTVIGALTVEGGSQVVLGANTLTFGAETDTAVGGGISGAGALVKAGTGTATLSGNNTYSGGTTISAGAITLSGGATLGSGGITMSGGSALNLSGGPELTNVIAIAAGLTATVDVSGGASTLSGVISGTGSILTKTGAETLTLSGINTYSGGTSLSAGAITLSGSGTIGDGTLTMSDGTALNLPGGKTLANLVAIAGGGSGIVDVSGGGGASTLSGVISGAGSIFTKTGGDTLILSENNTYSGGTVISGGTLQLSGSLAITGAVTVNGGATFDISGGADTVIGALSSQGGSTITLGSNSLTFGTASDTAVDGVISGTGRVIKVGVGTTTLSGINTYSGGTTVSAGTITLTGAGTIGSGPLTMGQGATINLPGNEALSNPLEIESGDTATVDVSEGPETLSGVISGDGSILTKTGAETLTLSGVNTYSGGTTLSAGAITLSGDGTIGTGTLTMSDGTALNLPGGKTVGNEIATAGGTVTVSASIGGASILSGVVSGTSLLTKTGDGTLTLSGNNTYSGGTTISSGTLALTGSLASTGAVTVNGTSTFDISGIGASQTIGALNTTAGTTINLGAKSLTFGNGIDTTIEGLIETAVGASVNLGIAGNIEGAGLLEKVGTGTATFSGNNTYSGGTNLTAGVIALSGSGTIGTGTLTMSAGTRLDLLSTQELANDIVIAGAGTRTVDVSGGAITLSGVISGDGSTFVKIGDSTLTLSGINTYSGGTSLSAGGIALSGAGTIGGGTLTMSDGTALNLPGGKTVANPVVIVGGGSGAVDVSGGIGVSELSGVISGADSILTKTGSETLILSGVNTYSGGTVISGGTLQLSGSLASTGAVTVNGGSVFDIGEGGGSVIGALTVEGGSQVILGENTLTFGTETDTAVVGVISGTGMLEKVGSGTVTISGNNTYSGGTTLTAGAIALSGPGTIGTSTLTMSDGTALNLSGVATVNNDITIAGGGSSTVDVSGGASTLSGVISGEGSTLIKTGSNSLALSGSNTYSGGTTISEGTFVLTGSLASTGAVTVNNASTFDISGIADSQTIGDLTTGAAATVNLGSKSLTFGTVSDTTIAGNIQGTGVLTKTGTGVVTFSGTSTFAETMAVSQGTAVINGVFPGAISASASSTVKGTGSIGGLLTVASGATLRPGNSIGTITLDSLTLDAGSTTTIEFDPSTTSLIDVTNAASLNGTLNLVQNAGSYPESGSYEILTADSITGEFSAITGGLDGFTFALSYSPNSVLLSYGGAPPPPPPSTLIDTEGLTGNLLKYANYLNAYAPESAEYSALAVLSGTELFNALNSASPARNATGTFVSQMTVFSLSGLVNSYLANQRYANRNNRSEAIANKFSLNSYDMIGYKDEVCPLTCVDSIYKLWINGFVDLAYQGTENQNVPFNFISGGVLVGFDYNQLENTVIGGTVGYAYSSIKNNQNMGGSDISYYAASLYADYVVDCLSQDFYIQGAFWGVFHQTDNQRNIIYSDINTKATSNFNGWQIDPHLELGFILEAAKSKVEPFISVDYVVNWEEGFTEKGALNLNVHQKSRTSSMFELETGVRLYQSIEKSTRIFGFKEEAGYIYRNPFDTGRVSSAIFGSPDFVTLTSFTKVQNLGFINATFFAQVGDRRDLMVSAGYEGQFGSDYIFNQVMLKISKSF